MLRLLKKLIENFPFFLDQLKLILVDLLMFLIFMDEYWNILKEVWPF